MGVLAVPTHGLAGARRRARGGRREDHLQLLGVAARRPAGGHRAHLEPRRRPALRSVLLPHLTPVPTGAFERDRDASGSSEVPRLIRAMNSIDLDEGRGDASPTPPTSRSGSRRSSRSSTRRRSNSRRASRSCTRRRARRRGAVREHHGRADLARRSRSSPAPAPTWRTRSSASASGAGGCSRSPSRTARCSRATGTHPWADYREQKIIDTEHYRRVEEGLKYVAWRNNTFSLHVHVGVRDIDRAVRVCDRLRPVLPLLLAISANSPFLDGRDSGPALLRARRASRATSPAAASPTRSAAGPPTASYLEFLLRTRSIVEFTQVWWSVRPHFDFGTVEVRICDAQASAQESEALAALIVACVAQAARDIDEGVPFEDLAGAPDRGEHVARDPLRPRRAADRPRARRGVPARERRSTACWRGRRRCAPSSASSPAFPEHNGAQRQRR